MKWHLSVLFNGAKLAIIQLITKEFQKYFFQKTYIFFRLHIGTFQEESTAYINTRHRLAFIAFFRNFAPISITMDKTQKVLIYDSLSQHFRQADAAEVPPGEIIMNLPPEQPGAAQKKSIEAMHRTDIEHFRTQRKMPVAVVLDNIRSLNNIGSIFRTCDGFACSGIILCGITATPPSPEIRKTALGAELSMNWHYRTSTREAIEELRREGYTIVCLEQVHGSVALQDFLPDPTAKYALIVGNEVDGVDPGIVADADLYLEIPQSGTKHSLNVAVATAVTLWEFYRHSDIVGKV